MQSVKTEEVNEKLVFSLLHGNLVYLMEDPVTRLSDFSQKREEPCFHYLLAHLVKGETF